MIIPAEVTEQDLAVIKTIKVLDKQYYPTTKEELKY